jgi:uncharacterized membrane protein
MDNSALQFLLAISLGIGLAATAGLRAFYPLLVVSVAAHFGWIRLNDSYAWLGHWPALTAFAVAALLEFAADKVPGFDHALHAVGAVVAPVAGTVLAASTLPGIDPIVGIGLGLIAGGVPAAAVHMTRAAVRPVSTATTAGIGNPIVSLGEDALAAGGIAASFLVPVAGAVIALSMIVGGFFLVRALVRRSRRGRTLSFRAGLFGRPPRLNGRASSREPLPWPCVSPAPCGASPAGNRPPRSPRAAAPPSPPPA